MFACVARCSQRIASNPLFMLRIWRSFVLSFDRRNAHCSVVAEDDVPVDTTNPANCDVLPRHERTKAEVPVLFGIPISSACPGDVLPSSPTNPFDRFA